MKCGASRPCRRKVYGIANASVQMKMKNPLLYLLIILSLSALLPTQASSEEIDFLNRPVNASGLTGLLITTSPFSLEPGAVETGVAVFSENSKRPDYTLSEYAALISVGAGNGTELAVRGSSFHKQASPAIKESGAGDTEVSFKWNFVRSKPESPALPAAAMIITGIAPTGNKDRELNRVRNWGARFGFSVGSEIGWRDHVLGIYADALMTLQDLHDDQYRDTYQTLNAGMIFPISKYRNLQLFIEYTAVVGKDVINVDGLDYTAFTYGLRLVSERLNLTVGTQFLHKDREGYENSERIIGMLSAKF